jgi:uncharacterized membrane protein YjgN (DUF898 family)
MENSSWKKSISFKGNDGKLIGLRIVNNILTVLTLGLYYPWAKVAVLKYLYGETSFQNHNFVFHGTGKEVFKGFIKAVAIFGGLYIFLIYAVASHQPSLTLIALLVFYFGIFSLIPLALHGSYKYRLSRTSWRGIHFGYRGNLKELYGIFIKNILLTIVTMGIYASWMQVAVKSYMRKNIRFGNIEFKFIGEGSDLFVIKLKGIILMVLTLGIYSFWYYKELAQFEIDNTRMYQDGKEIKFKTTLTGGKMFSLIVVNYFIVLFTFGIGTGIAINRTMRIFLENILLSDEIDADAILQTEDNYGDATGDDIAGFLDLPLV